MVILYCFLAGQTPQDVEYSQWKTEERRLENFI